MLWQKRSMQNCSIISSIESTSHYHFRLPSRILEFSTLQDSVNFSHVIVVLVAAWFAVTVI